MVLSPFSQSFPGKWPLVVLSVRGDVSESSPVTLPTSMDGSSSSSEWGAAVCRIVTALNSKKKEINSEIKFNFQQHILVNSLLGELPVPKAWEYTWLLKSLLSNFGMGRFLFFPPNFRILQLWYYPHEIFVLILGALYQPMTIHWWKACNFPASQH